MSCASVIGIARRRIFPEMLPSPKSRVSVDFAFGKAVVLFLCKRFNFGNFLSDAGMDFFTLA